MAATLSTPMPSPFMRPAAVLGPIPQSMSIIAPPDRTTEQLPADPLARMESDSDIRALKCFAASNRRDNRLKSEIQIIQHILRLASALGNLADEERLEFQSRPARGDLLGDLAVEAAGVVILHGDDPATA